MRHFDVALKLLSRSDARVINFLKRSPTLKYATGLMCSVTTSSLPLLQIRPKIFCITVAYIGYMYNQESTPCHQVKDMTHIFAEFASSVPLQAHSLQNIAKCKLHYTIRIVKNLMRNDVAIKE